MRCSSLIEVYNTICLNGIVAKKRTLFVSSYLLEISYCHVLPSPRNPLELFNLRHASACNVVEQIFGVLKRCFQVLRDPPEYDMDTQTLIPPALAALHNFIWQYDPDEIQMYGDDAPLDLPSPALHMGPHPETLGELQMYEVTPAERVQAKERQDQIANSMWQQYQQYLESRVAD